MDDKKENLNENISQEIVNINNNIVVEKESNKATSFLNNINNNNNNNISDELQNEINKMIKRNVTYLNIKENDKNYLKTKKVNINKDNVKNKPIRRTYNKFKKVSTKKNNKLKQLTKAGKDLENKMLEEISERRKKNKIQKEKKKAQKLEGELKVGNMTVIKDISKLRKRDKKTKNKIYKLSSEVINKIMKKK
ncbi:hypothetical protein PFNF135_05276 [Plasmodium falciparum NF135/5.C10]|uniref:Uncharacterized protein n=2 Tax=Plasmodium falciparum TaxID=5833 RepID=A0A024V0A8_PLAFA|nr:hypothetical protein PFFVO_04700 [Plasmodium falciparum Vietnam Oak-Knoll (FVO)]ETW40340.1 hypothetical protein PFNF135_05276 [Plasmodium falciparum NF135/5.C10]